MSTLFVNNLNTASGTTITVPTGKKLVVTDSGGVTAPGMVLQTLNNQHTGQESTASGSFVATSLNLSITPKFNTSKILVKFSLPVYAESGDHSVATVFRESGTASYGSAISGTNLGHSSWGFGSTFSDSGASICVINASIFDSPNTTSAVRYTVAFRQHNTGTVLAFVNNAMGTLTLQEIAQ